MPYIRRNAEGQIESLHRAETEGDEYLDAEHADVQAFLGRTPGEGAFSRLDADFVRVIEDVIDTLLTKNILNITDLPGEAQAKLFARKSFRDRSSRNSLHLFGNSEFGDII